MTDHAKSRDRHRYLVPTQGLEGTPSLSSLYDAFERGLKLNPSGIALEVGGHQFTYDELGRLACSVSMLLRPFYPTGTSPVVGILAYRSMSAYVGILGALHSGSAYMPLSIRFPVSRNANMMARSSAFALVVDEISAVQLPDLLAGNDHCKCLIFPWCDDPRDFQARFPGLSCFGRKDLLSIEQDTPQGPFTPASLAYLLFTSGSTGIPKGVPISHANVTSFLEYMIQRYPLNQEDRASQNFELTFDPSVCDMFLAWASGATLCVPSRNQLINPASFIKRNRLTFWYSVPSIGIFMHKLGVLKNNAFPTLKWSCFAGEALSSQLAIAWSKAAPSSVIDNLYGPTEVTVTCFHHRFESDNPSSISENGTVPIGLPNPGMTALVVDSDLREVQPGQKGELLVAGPQVSGRYWDDPEMSRRAFVSLGSDASVFFRTGDLVRRPPTSKAPMAYLGRIDQQVQILGHRVELSEVEGALREVFRVGTAVVLPWPVSVDGVAEGLVAILESPEPLDVSKYRQGLESYLPEYMIPRDFHVLPHLPLTPSGKVDRRALHGFLEARQ